MKGGGMECGRRGEAEFSTDTNGVRYMTIYGIKGMAAYAVALGEETPGSPSLYIRLEDERRWYGGGEAEYGTDTNDVCYHSSR